MWVGVGVVILGVPLHVSGTAGVGHCRSELLQV